MTEHYHVAVIGGGMAGVSVAAELASNASVVLLEREAHLGFHSTGRSAAVYSGIYGDEIVRAITHRSREFLETPPPGFCDYALLTRREVYKLIATRRQTTLLRRYYADSDVAERTTWLSSGQARLLCPLLKAESVAAALLERDACDIDVNGLLQGYLRTFRARGGIIATGAAVTRLERKPQRWEIDAGGVRVSADVVVNAAGAWADDIGRMAGATTIGLTPLRRTAILVAPPAGQEVEAWPMVVDVEERFYFKPDAGLLLLCPADEEPVEPRGRLPRGMGYRRRGGSHTGGYQPASELDQAELGGRAKLCCRSPPGGGL